MIQFHSSNNNNNNSCNNVSTNNLNNKNTTIINIGDSNNNIDDSNNSSSIKVINNSNNNFKNSNNSNNQEPFFKVWRNVVLKNTIINILQTSYHGYRVFKSREQLLKFNNRNSIKVLEVDFNEPLQPGDIPKVEELIFGKHYNCTLQKEVIPDSVRVIKFKQDFKVPLEPGYINEGCETIILAQKYMHPIFPGVFPNSTRELELNIGGSLSEYLMDGSFPDGLTSLTLDGYDRRIDPAIFPRSLTSLFLPSFNQEIHPGDLPYIKRLELFPRFTCPLIEGSLNGVTQLKMGLYFDHPIDHLPSTLTSLDFGFLFNQKLVPNQLPPSLTYLNLGFSYDQIIEPNVLPSSLLILKFGMFNCPIKNVFPSSIEDLDLGFRSNIPLQIGDIPANCKVLKLNRGFNHKLSPGLLPQSITTLIFGLGYNRSFSSKISLPNLTHLSFEGLNSSLKNLPPNLTHLNLGKCFKYPIEPGQLPKSLIKLEFGEKFDQSLNEFLDPNQYSSLKYITIGQEYSKIIYFSHLPKSLIALSIPDIFYREFNHYELQDVENSNMVVYKKN